MLPGMEEVVYVGGRQQWLARGLYYVDCDCRNESVKIVEYNLVKYF